MIWPARRFIVRDCKFVHLIHILITLGNAITIDPTNLDKVAYYVTPVEYE